MKKMFVLFILVFLLILNLKSSEPEEYEITPLIENALLYNRLYIKKRMIKNSPWPEITIITSVDATPQQSAAIFFAYEEHKEFISDLLVSKPIKYISPTELHLYFEMNLPWPLKNSHFITNNILSKVKKGGYKIRWEFVKSGSTKDSSGSISFLPYKERTMLIYKNYTLPKSGLAKLFKNSMYKKVKITVKSIKNRIETIVKKRKERVYKYVENLNKALTGEYIYKEIAK